jgi:hypothetical protein
VDEKGVVGVNQLLSCYGSSRDEEERGWGEKKINENSLTSAC